MSARPRILAAAAAEFAARGPHGVRIEHVANRAGLNKALIYRHFTDRERLFEATLAHQIEARSQMVAALPDDLAAMLAFWGRQQRADADFVRLLAQEGLAHDGGAPALGALRRDYYDRQIAAVARLQEAAQVPREMDARALFLALLLLTVGPILLPQIAALVLGDDADEDWDAFLGDLAGALERAAEAPGD